jgi:hypothetical protein
MVEASSFAADDSGKGNLRLAQALSQSARTTTETAGIIPADRITTWNPGLNAVGRHSPSDDDILRRARGISK